MNQPPANEMGDLRPTIYMRSVTKIIVSMWPDELVARDPVAAANASAFDLTIEERSPDRWAVARSGGCLGSDGRWDYERFPSNRTAEYVRSFRFTLPEATELATAAAPLVVVNGMTAVEAMQRDMERQERG